MLKHQRARAEAVDHEGPQDDRRNDVARHTERQQRNHGRPADAVVAGFRRRYALKLTLPEALRSLRGPPGLTIGEEGRRRAPNAGYGA